MWCTESISGFPCGVPPRICGGPTSSTYKPPTADGTGNHKIVGLCIGFTMADATYPW